MPEKTLIQKLSEVMAEVGYVQKDATNEFHKYRYASAEAVLKKVNAALSERGIAISSQAELLRYDTFTADKGMKALAVVKLSIDFTDGIDKVHAEGLGSGLDSGDKAVMKANTAALKYLVANEFLISWGDDPEADTATDAELLRGTDAPEVDPFKNGEISSYPNVALPLPGTKGISDAKAVIGHAQARAWSEEEFVTWYKGIVNKDFSQITAAQATFLLKRIKEES